MIVQLPQVSQVPDVMIDHEQVTKEEKHQHQHQHQHQQERETQGQVQLQVQAQEQVQVQIQAKTKAQEQSQALIGETKEEIDIHQHQQHQVHHQYQQTQLQQLQQHQVHHPFHHDQMKSKLKEIASDQIKTRPIKPKPPTVDKYSRGLRHFAIQVLLKVQDKKKTTYNEMADELVSEILDQKKNISVGTRRTTEQQSLAPGVAGSDGSGIVPGLEEGATISATVSAVSGMGMLDAEVKTQGVTDPDHIHNPDIDHGDNDLDHDSDLNHYTDPEDKSQLPSASTTTKQKRKIKKKYFSSDEKNIRRRVYDAINVLIALGMIEKKEKQIQWIGWPFYTQNAADEVEQVRSSLQDRSERIAAKKDRIKQLQCHIASLHKLIEHNSREFEKAQYFVSPARHTSLPVLSSESPVVITTNTNTTTTPPTAVPTLPTSGVGGFLTIPGTAGLTPTNPAVLTTVSTPGIIGSMQNTSTSVHGSYPTPGPVSSLSNTPGKVGLTPTNTANGVLTSFPSTAALSSLSSPALLSDTLTGFSPLQKSTAKNSWENTPDQAQPSPLQGQHDTNNHQDHKKANNNNHINSNNSEKRTQCDTLERIYAPFLILKTSHDSQIHLEVDETRTEAVFTLDQVFEIYTDQDIIKRLEAGRTNRNTNANVSGILNQDDVECLYSSQRHASSPSNFVINTPEKKDKMEVVDNL